MKRSFLDFCVILLGGLLMLGCAGEKKEEPQSQFRETEKPSATLVPEGVGVITCQVVFEGSIPTPARIKMSADPKCAAVHKDEVHTQAVLANEKGELENVFVYMRDGLGSRRFPTPQDPVVIDQKGCMYEPHVLGMQVNQPILIKNSDPTLHNIHALPKRNEAFNIAQPIQGMRSEKTFTEPEVMVRIKCDVHSWMGCYVGVLDHPYYAVTRANGACDLTNLPPGNYVISAWHEQLGTLEQNVTLAAGESKKIEFRFRVG
jgi:hypothetical protein